MSASRSVTTEVSPSLQRAGPAPRLQHDRTVIRPLDAQGTGLYAQTDDPYPSVEPDELQASDLVVAPDGDLFVSGMCVLPGRFHDFELPELQGAPGDAFLLRLRPGTSP